MRRIRSALGAAVLLFLGIAIPATFHASWVPWVLWVLAGTAAAALILLSTSDRIPWRVERKDPETERVIGRAMMRVLLRHDLQIAFRNLTDNLKTPTPAELRAFADNLAARLRDDGYSVTAKKAEVHLPDNADAAAIKKRLDELDLQLMRLLIWDEFE